MNPERWRQVEKLYHAALDSAPDSRVAFLDSACGNDTELRQTLEALLAQGEQARSFLEKPALDVTAPLSMGLLGAQFGAYRIVSHLGAGGMGEVYRAHDSKLGRDVAIKTLPSEFARDPERLARFAREARVLASLNHPNIAMIHGLEESGGVSYLVLELVEGEDLKQRIDRSGPWPVPEALNICRQVADALESAHSQGIVHRDLKPANVKVTPAGRVKVLDFGLAKAILGEDESGWDLSRMTTAAGSNTVAGQILGTPAYMSPEQTRGAPVDKRIDTWAFGCLLYELLTGKQAFRGDTLPDTLAAIQSREPDWQALPTDIPVKIRDLLRRCLQKDASRRLQDMAQARSEIEEALAPPRRRGLSRVQVAGLVVLAIMLFAAGVILYQRGSFRPPDRSQWVQITNLPDSVTQPALSPDGRMLTFLRGPNPFVGQSEVYLKMLPDGEPLQLTRDGMAKMSPAFSPDGSRIAYTVLDQNSWDTWTVPVSGGMPRLWLSNVEGMSWIDKHSLLYSEVKTGQHMAIATSLDSRAEHRDIYVPAHQDGMAHRSNLSPDGKWVLIVEMDEKGVWMPCRLTPFDGSSAGKQVGPAGLCRSAVWSKDGKWMYLSVNAGDDFHVWRQRFPEGKPEQLTSGPNAEEGIAVAPDGHSLITAVGSSQRPISFHDAAGDHQVSLEGYTFSPLLYAAGRKVVYRISLSKGYQGMGTLSELWTADLDSGRNEPLLPGFQVIAHDVSRDGQVLVCALDAKGKPRLWIVALDKRSPPRQVGSVEATGAYFGPPGLILFLAMEGASSFVFGIREDGTGLRKMVMMPVSELNAVSPDGRWVSGHHGYTAPGGKNVYAFAYSMTGGARVGLCDAPAIVKWAPDGRYLYIQKSTGFTNGGAVGRTYVLPTLPGTMLPKLPAGGFKTEAELAAAPGVRIIDAADVGPGPTPDVYVFSRENVQRNLYRIPLP